jgi:hypothetical protein
MDRGRVLAPQADLRSVDLQTGRRGREVWYRERGNENMEGRGTREVAGVTVL